MTKPNCVILLLFVLSMLVVSCSENTEQLNRDAEIREISNVIDAAIGWFKTKDFSVMFTAFAQDSNFLEVHPTDNVVKGFEQFKKNSEIFKNPEFLYVRHEIWDQKITLSKNGDTAWFFCMLNDISTWKGRQTGWENTRWTGVLEKRNGKWVIVQQHFSFAAE
ncbi:nuclear transport factor 2 family protein [Bacteroidota bacterium]